MEKKLVNPILVPTWCRCWGWNILCSVTHALCIEVDSNLRWSKVNIDKIMHTYISINEIRIYAQNLEAWKK